MLEVVMPLKDRLLELRKAAGLTQQALAFKAGLSISVVVHIERGRIPDPRVSTVRAIAGALGCKVDDLLAGGPGAPPEGPPQKGRGKRGGRP
jgi:transcriptional regulator with XRE-family HTH domain